MTYDLTFTHAMRGVVHATMAAVVDMLDEHGDMYVGAKRIRFQEDMDDFIQRSLEMSALWSSVNKHFADQSYVWLPSSGVLPDDLPVVGVDCYVEIDQTKRRKGGIAARLAHLERIYDGHKLH